MKNRGLVALRSILTGSEFYLPFDHLYVHCPAAGLEEVVGKWMPRRPSPHKNIRSSNFPIKKEHHNKKHSCHWRFKCRTEIAHAWKPNGEVWVPKPSWAKLHAQVAGIGFLLTLKRNPHSRGLGYFCSLQEQHTVKAPSFAKLCHLRNALRFTSFRRTAAMLGRRRLCSSGSWSGAVVNYSMQANTYSIYIIHIIYICIYVYYMH